LSAHLDEADPTVFEIIRKVSSHQAMQREQGPDSFLGETAAEKFRQSYSF